MSPKPLPTLTASVEEEDRSLRLSDLFDDRSIIPERIGAFMRSRIIYIVAFAALLIGANSAYSQDAPAGAKPASAGQADQRQRKSRT